MSRFSKTMMRPWQMVILIVGGMAFLPIATTAGGAGDSLRVEIFHHLQELERDSLPQEFPRHRPFKLLLRTRGRLHTRLSNLQIADTLAALERLTGLQYYSRTEKKHTTLFKASAVLAHPAARQAARSPVFRSLPVDTAFYFYQIDNRLGRVIYRADLRSDRSSVRLLAQNLSPVSKWGMQLAEIGDFIVLIELHRRAGGELEFCLWQWSRFKGGILGILVQEESFVHRLRAVAGFYLARLSAPP